MAETKELPFTFRAGQPMVVSVVANDGKPYEIRIGIMVVRIGDTGQVQQSPHGEVPKLEVQVQLAIDTRPNANG